MTRLQRLQARQRELRWQIAMMVDIIQQIADDLAAAMIQEWKRKP